MPEKKIDIIKILEEISEKCGYKLQKKETERKIPELPPTTKQFEEMPAKELSSEIRELDTEIQKMEVISTRVREGVVNFMNNEQANEVTKTVFEGTRFEDRRLQITDKNMILKKNLKSYLQSLLKRAFEKEMAHKLVQLTPDLKGIVKDMTVKQTASGHALIVTIGKIKEQTLDSFALKDEQKRLAEDAKRKGVTTTESINMAGRY